MSTITTLPPAPSRADPTNFAVKADALLGALDQFVTETNAVASETVTNKNTAVTSAATATTKAGEASTSATTATTQAGIATTKAGEASISAAAALVSENDAAASALAAAVAAGSVASYPDQTGNNGKFLKTNGIATSWDFAGIANVSNVTTSTTLTSTPTLLNVNPAATGVVITMPDATTCAKGGPNYVIKNIGAFSFVVRANGGALIANILAGQTAVIYLNDNSIAAGTWTASSESTNLEFSSAVPNTSTVIFTTGEPAQSTALTATTGITIFSGTSNYPCIAGFTVDASNNISIGSTVVLESSVTNAAALQIVAISSTQAVAMWMQNSTGYLRFCVVTYGTPVAVGPTLSHNVSTSTLAEVCKITKLTSNLVVAVYRDGAVNPNIMPIAISGTTLTSWGATGAGTSGAAEQFSLIRTSDTSALFGYVASGVIYIYKMTVTTAPSYTMILYINSLSSTASKLQMCAVSSTKVLLVYMDGSIPTSGMLRAVILRNVDTVGPFPEGNSILGIGGSATNAIRMLRLNDSYVAMTYGGLGALGFSFSYMMVIACPSTIATPINITQIDTYNNGQAQSLTALTDTKLIAGLRGVSNYPTMKVLEIAQ